MADKKADTEQKASKKNGTVIARCENNCQHLFQDAQYKGMRLHNIAGGGTKKRCTVCGKVS